LLLGWNYPNRNTKVQNLFENNAISLRNYTLL